MTSASASGRSLRFSGVAQSLREGFQGGIVICSDEGGLEQDMPQGAPSSGDGSFAPHRAAVVRYGSEPRQVCGLFSGYGPEFGHFCDQHSAGNGADPGNGAQDTGGFDQCSVGRDCLLDAFFQL